MAVEQKQSSVVDSIVGAIMEPGVGSGVVCILNTSLLALIVTLFVLLMVWTWNVHIVILLLLTLTLLGLINWFVLEVQRLPESKPVENHPDDLSQKADSSSKDKDQ